MSAASLIRRSVAESVGSALLAAAVVGSGIMGERLAGGSGGLALLSNSLATGAALVALILSLGPISGAHFNPVVTLADAWNGGTRWPEVPAYLARSLTDTFSGICPGDVPGFIAAQSAGAAAAAVLFWWLAPGRV